MKYSLFAASALVAAVSAVAIPEPGNNWANWGRKDGKDGKDGKGFPIPFTSTYRVKATPEQVVNATNAPTGGLPGAVGYYDFGINSDLDIICYYIKLVDFSGEYQSPARTATHIHESAVGKSGPPRIAFPNPQNVPGQPENVRISAGCLTGPFVTGVNNTQTGLDQGVGFTLKAIEANPRGFNADVHSSKAVPGAVRGQLSEDC